MTVRSIAAALCVCAGAAVAQAGVVTTLNFGLINGGINLGVGGTNQLVCEVRDDLPDASPLGANQARFRFLNLGPTQSSITDIYFEDGTLLAIAAIYNGATGVSFSQYASPGHLPGHNLASPPFQSHNQFQADSNAPAQPNGVNPGEEVSIVFDLQANKTMADVLACLIRAGETGFNPADHDGLRIGLHVQGYGNGSSNSYVNLPPDFPENPVIPLPHAAGLGLFGLGMLATRRSRPS
jgi:hypothetical protein